MKNINNIQIDDELNFPGDDGSGRNITRRVNGFGIVTITDMGYVTYKAEAGGDQEICGRLGENFKSEAELLSYISEEFEG